MNLNEYAALALRTEADQQAILLRLVCLGPAAMRLDNAARGLADEVGEINAIVKKHIEYGQPLSREAVAEEVGDVLWRLAQLCAAAGVDLGQCMRDNLTKLSVRYPDRYTDQLSAERNYEAEQEAVRATRAMAEGLAGPPKAVARQGTIRGSWGGPEGAGRRTKMEVMRLRREQPHAGCCEAYADNQSCRCLQDASGSTGCNICHDPNCGIPNEKH